MNGPQTREPGREHVEATSTYAAQRTEELRRRRDELRARRLALEREREALVREEAALEARIEEELHKAPPTTQEAARRQEIEGLLEAYHNHNSDVLAHREELEKIRQLAAEHWYALATLWPWFAELKQVADEGNHHREWLVEEMASHGLELPEPESYVQPDVMRYLAPTPNLPRNVSWLHALTELGLKYGD